MSRTGLLVTVCPMTHPFLPIAAGLLVLFSWTGSAHANADRADVEPDVAPPASKPVAWKLSLGRYRDSVDGYATDVNLRGNTEDLTFWIGHYDGAEGFRQSRAGVERQSPLPLGRLIYSAQAASGGFLGGSVTWDLRTSPDPFFAPMVGWGRTNTKTYYNLNFDPNDSYLVGGSFSLPSKALLSVYLVADDRLGTGQKVTHAVFRRPIGKDMRLTVDLFSRQGRSEAGAPRVSGNGLSVGWDYRDFFLKFTHDARANFTPANMNRLVTGFRF